MFLFRQNRLVSYSHSVVIAVKAFCLLLLSSQCFAQNYHNYIWPIDSPFSVTGNYGELRPNHFHAGIDFSTHGVINLPIYAVEEGYVSRIRVSTTGYGKSIYITHPDGKVSLYAHLNVFSLKIASIAKKQQYNIQNYEFDLLLKPKTVFVIKNEIIALSGNTGSSTGPHLHFEIRDELSETPLNPFLFYKLTDNSPPELWHLGFYDLSDTCDPRWMNGVKVTRNHNDSLVLADDHLVLEYSIVGLSFAGFDRLFPLGNPNNIYSAELYLDDQLIYSHTLDHIDFADGRYCNEFSEAIGKHKYQKCFLPEMTPPEMYHNCINKGRLILNDSVYKKLRLKVQDEFGNSSSLQCYVKARKINGYRGSAIKSDLFVKSHENFDLAKDNVQIHIPANTLYYSTPIIIENTIASSGKLIILPREANLRSPYTLGLAVPERYRAHAEQLVLRSGKSVFTPVLRNDSLFYSLKNFDWYHLELDTLPPQIKTEYSSRKLKEVWKMDSFSFHITDHLSGVGRYNVWLNNIWVLAEYDTKTDLLTYYFDEETPIGLLQYRVEVIDRVGNKKYFDYLLKK